MTTSKSHTARQQRRHMADEVRDQKREQILSVAEALFFERGYAQTTVADIVEALGVTKPYLYYYFNGKDDIFEQLCWRASVACLTAMHTEADDPRPAALRLEEGLHRLATANIRHFKSGTFAYREAGALARPFQARLRAMARAFHDDLRTLLEQARDDGDLDFGNATLTSHAIGSVVGFMYTWYKPDGPIPQDEMANEITRTLMDIAGFCKSARRRQLPLKHDSGPASTRPLPRQVKDARHEKDHAAVHAGSPTRAGG